ncbi:MAG: hypothetical protein E2O54_07675 [Gammaproteobacteria bacterium]|nr:MAG: hypothetical protein E2O54_07675 [Gammaproteobacteria bacterium]
MPFRAYKRGFDEAVAGHPVDPPPDPQRVIRGDCSERSHYHRGYADGRRHREDMTRQTAAER